MKKIFLTGVTFALLISAQAQTVNDTVSIGAGYTNQTWHSLQNDDQGTAPKNNWDIAFQCTGMGASILINSVTGTKLWLYPGADTSGWASLDTTGLSTWTARYNSDTSWVNGAFSTMRNPGNPYDLGWGIYSTITHYVTGDSLFVIKLAGGSYKKIWIKLLAGGIYTFRYANLDGTADTTAQLAKTAYTGKNFGYCSLQSNTALDREPPAISWDLLFTQYTAFIPQPYTVSGVLSNIGVTVAQAYPVDTGSVSWTNYTFATAINEIGYDWKVYSGVWTIGDSLVYFIKDVPGNIWKAVFTGFGGSADGNYIFSKEKVSSTGVDDNYGTATGSMTVYPNPANGESTTVIYSFTKPVASAVLTLSDITGKRIFSETLGVNADLNTVRLNTSRLHTGMYLVTMESDGNRLQQKLLVQ